MMLDMGLVKCIKNTYTNSQINDKLNIEISRFFNKTSADCLLNYKVGNALLYCDIKKHNKKIIKGILITNILAQPMVLSYILDY